MANKGINLAKAYVQIIPSADGISGSITKALGGEASLAGKSSGKAFGSNLVSTIKNVIIVAGIGKAIGMSISEGAALEQSIGGIETLFKDSADKMKEYAANAYATAGLSANAYMEQATGFAASLLQGLNGDTKKAAEAANQALIDMADNSNKMGTALESIQNAYAGFAKQNYTMLDNLKLGYGGTKKEMQRLLADAEKISGVKYDIENLSDVYEAIHVIQGKLDITGTTAKEAMTTISGSAAAMKAAFSNVLGNMALGENIKPALKSLVETTSTFLFKNLIPAVWNVISLLPEALIQLVTSAAPMIMDYGKEFITNLITGISGEGPMMLEQIYEIVTGLIDGFINYAPELINAGVQVVESLSQGLISGIPNFISNALPIILRLSQSLRENIGTIIDAGINLILNLAQGIADGLPALIAYVPEIISNIANIINDNLPKILAAGISIIVILVQGLINAIPTIVANLPKIISAIWDTMVAFKWINLGKNIIMFMVNGIKAMVSTVASGAKSVLTGIVNTFKNFDFLSLGKNIVQGIINGVTNMGSSLLNALKNLAINALNAAKSVLGIHSPSRVFENQVGKMIDLGMAQGIENNVNHVSDAMKEISKSSIGMINTDITPEIRSEYPKESENDTIGLLQNLYSLLGLYLPQLANMEMVMDTGRVVGALAPAMDKELGIIGKRRSRQ